MSNNIKKWKAISMFLLLGLTIIVLFIIDDNIDKKQQQIAKIEKVEKTFKKDVQENARDQARKIAKGISMCIKQEIQRREYNTIDSMMKTIKNCGAEHRSGGETGDFFVFDRISKEMVYDGSPDCMKGGANRYFYRRYEDDWIDNGTKRGECWMHNEPKKCKEAIERLYKVGNTKQDSQIWRKFDDSREWLESYVIPSLSAGFNGPVGENGLFEKGQKNIQLQIVVGTQKDEVMKNFEDTINRYRNIKRDLEDYINTIFWTSTFMASFILVLSFILTIQIKK